VWVHSIMNHAADTPNKPVSTPGGRDSALVECLFSMTPLPGQAACEAEGARDVFRAVGPRDDGDSLQECAEGAGVRREVQHLDVAAQLEIEGKT